MKFTNLFLLVFLLILTLVSAQITSPNYNINSIVVSNGGTNVTSTNYKTDATVGDIIGNISSNSYKEFLGFWYTIKNDTAPTQSIPILNSSTGNNLTTDNLTCYNQSTYDVDGDSVTNVYNWYKNGSAIAVLNMPFDNYIANASIADSIKDYSGYGNNGTGGGGNPDKTPTWVSDGKVGGAYKFDGVNDYIDVGNNPSLNITKAITIEAWVYPLEQSSGTVYKGVITKGGRWDTSSSYQLYYYNYGINGQMRWGTGTDNYTSVGYAISNNQWVYAVLTLDTNGNVKLYVNGILRSSNSLPAGEEMLSNTNSVWTGDTSTDSGSSEVRQFNGTIDEVKIYNHSLSASQIYQNYLDTKDGHSNRRTIVSDETAKGDDWTCEITPNDARKDGNTLNSSNLTILNSLPTVTLTAPTDWNATTNRSPEFSWTGYDADGDNLTYEFNLTIDQFSGFASCSDDRLITGITNTSYIPTDDLKCLYDNGFYYNWSVRARDNSGYGNWSSVYHLNITAQVSITLNSTNMIFGQLAIGGENDTTDNSPPPFIINNSGNVLTNVSVNSSAIWDSEPDNSSYYQFKANNVTGEDGAFNWLGSIVSWFNMPINANVVAIDKLNYSANNNSAKVDIRLQVPPNEAPGSKSATTIFTAQLAE